MCWDGFESCLQGIKCGSKEEPKKLGVSNFKIL